RAGRVDRWRWLSRHRAAGFDRSDGAELGGLYAPHRSAAASRLWSRALRTDRARRRPDADLSGRPDDADARAEQPARYRLEIPLPQAAVRGLPAARAMLDQPAVAERPDGH